VWYREAEELLGSLKGVLSARVVARGDGAVEEVHILTTDEVSPKQTVRNVESALLARYDVTLDHRKISVAQTTARPPAREPRLKPAREVDEPATIAELPLRRPKLTPPTPPFASEPSKTPPRPQPSTVESTDPVGDPTVRPDADPIESPTEERLLFLSHTVETLRSHRLQMKVQIEWRGERYVGESAGADLARARLEGFAVATLRAIETALDPTAPPEEREGVSLSLDGVQLVEAFDRQFVLVAVNALLGGEITLLTGAAAVDDSRDRAVVLATLQATDRRVRAFLQGDLGVENGRGRRQSGSHPDPFDVWA